MSSSALPGAATINRIPSLDGLRAISILLVVALHTIQRYGASHHVATAWFALFNGSAGVFIFFEISGFLITTLLLKEDAKRGSVSLKGFYLRRAFRILPPLYLYVGVIVLLGLLGHFHVAPIDVVGSAFFFHNLVGGGTWALEHLWSISVEEQFYLVWPFVLIYCLRCKGLAARYAAAKFPAAIILLSPFLRVALYMTGNPALKVASISYLRFDFIMFGCLVALLQNTPRFEALYQACTRFWWAPPAVMLLCNALSARFQNYFDLTVGFTINGFAIAMFLLWSTRNAQSVVGRFLNSWGMAKIGVLSYSIYLWQTLFLHEGNQSVFARVPWLGTFPGNWLGFLLAGAGSYYIVEQPSLRWRDRMISALRVYRAGRGAKA